MEKPLLPIISMEKNYPDSVPVRFNKIKFILLFLGVAIIIGCLPLLTVKLGILFGWTKLIMIILFLGEGFFYEFRIRQSSKQADNKDILLFTVQLTFLILLALLIVYYVISPGLVLMALGSACAFMLPFIIGRSWDVFNFISQVEYGVWSIPVSESLEKTFIYFGGLPVKVKFSIARNDRDKKIFKSFAPVDKTVGEFFNHFLLIQRNNNKLNIELLDEDQKPFGWKFYEIDWFGLRKKQLNPEANIEELEMKRSGTILAQRVRLST